ncbi:hypothetical protein V2S66_18965 [Streptomyces sp. V4-01]|uniref:Uncharacterized protein n=1 Tax=Actinacidiphila polyblastidii TaxID=3110430 RepID=A0ABU7PE11_9ACTN|nr:hypothetical protein [Streptomyces sp. V4-01]
MLEDDYPFSASLEGGAFYTCEQHGLDFAWAPLIETETARLVAEAATDVSPGLFAPELPALIEAIDTAPVPVQQALIRKAAARHLARPAIPTPRQITAQIHNTAATRPHATPLTTARTILLAHSFQPAPAQGADTLVLVRIDREEAHYADAATRALRDVSLTVGVAFALLRDFDTNPTRADHPLPHLSRQEIRTVGAEAQTIHDDIAASHLVIHHQAADDGFVAAVGTYTSGSSVLLNDEDHLRHIVSTYDRKTDAVAEFPFVYGSALRAAPAPATRHPRRAAHHPHPQRHRGTGRHHPAGPVTHRNRARVRRRPR